MSNVYYSRTYSGLFIYHSTQKNPQEKCFDMHSHNEYELLFLLSGDVTEVIEDRKYKLRKYDLVLIRPNNYHYIQVDSPEDYDRYVIYFEPTTLGIDNIQLLEESPEVWSCRHRPVIIELFKRLDYYQTMMDKETLKDMTCLLLKELIFNLSFTDSGDRPMLENVHPVVSKALAEINANLLTIKNVSHIAEKLYVTESYLYRIFKQELKTTPYKYITEKRLQIAHSMLAQGIPPTLVYRECGFNDYTSFYRSYVKQFGHSPSNSR